VLCVANSMGRVWGGRMGSGEVGNARKNEKGRWVVRFYDRTSMDHI